MIARLGGGEFSSKKARQGFLKITIVALLVNGSCLTYILLPLEAVIIGNLVAFTRALSWMAVRLTLDK